MSDRFLATRVMVDPKEGPLYYMHFLWCPGCDDIHRVNSAIQDVDPGENITWEWDGDKTFSPSILVTGGANDVHCHSFVRNGSWEFLPDCTHRLAGKTVSLMPIPDDFSIHE